MKSPDKVKPITITPAMLQALAYAKTGTVCVGWNVGLSKPGLSKPVTDATLRALASKGLVTLSRNPNNETCGTITPAGLAALAQAIERAR